MIKGWWARALVMFLAAVIIAGTLVGLSFRVSVKSERGFLSIGISQNVYAQEPIIPEVAGSSKSSISYVGEFKGKLQIVVALYLEPDDPYYDKHYVYVVDWNSPEAQAGYPGKVDAEGNPTNLVQYQKWLDGLPHVWQNNPFHNHVLYFDADATDEEIKTKIAISSNYFYNFWHYIWDNNLEFIPEWQKVPKKAGTVRDVFVTGSKDAANLAAINAKIVDLEARKSEFGSTVTGITSTDLNIGEKGTITIGPGAIDRAIYHPAGYTRIDKNGPANADGVLDTFEFWFNSANNNNVHAGTFSGSGTSWDDRDYEIVGYVAGGSKQTFSGLSIDVITGDLAGMYSDASGADGRIERAFTSSQNYSVGGNKFGTGVNTYASDYGPMSIYGTGTEAGGDPDISVSPTSYNFGVVTENSTPSTATNYFTITNNSTMQTDQTIAVTTNTWSGGVGWTHSDTATAGVDTAGLLANRGGTWGVGDIIVKYNAPNYIYENCPATTGYDFGLKLIAPTEFTDGIEKTITVRITAAAD